MDKQKIVRYALIALAAYIVWRYLESRGGLAGLFGSLSNQPVLPPGTQPDQTVQSGSQASGTQTGQQGQQPSSSTASSGQSAPAVPSDSDLMAAAYDPAQAGKTGAYKLNFHQWNWYRMQAAIAATGTYSAEKHQPAWDGIVDPETQVTAAEYQAQLARRGLAGMSGWSSGYSMGGWSSQGVIQ
jgi:hypothetical protein